MGRTEIPDLKPITSEPWWVRTYSKKAKWRALWRAHIGTLRKGLTPPTLLERRFNAIFRVGLRLLLVDGREIVIANADHPTTQGFASLIEDEVHEWKFQLKMPGGMPRFILLGKHFSPPGESCTSTWIVQQRPASLQYGGLLIMKVVVGKDWWNRNRAPL